LLQTEAKVSVSGIKPVCPPQVWALVVGCVVGGVGRGVGSVGRGVGSWLSRGTRLGRFFEFEQGLLVQLMLLLLGVPGVTLPSLPEGTEVEAEKGFSPGRGMRRR